MSNEEFLRRLEAALTGRVPQEELDDAMNYHREYFAEAGENAADGIPAPEEVAAQIIREREGYLRKRQIRWAMPAIVIALCVGLVATVGILGGHSLLQRWIGWGRTSTPTAALERTTPPILSEAVTDVVEGEASYVTEGTGGLFQSQEGDTVYVSGELDSSVERIVIEGVSDHVTITPGGGFFVDVWHDQQELLDCNVKDGTLYMTGKLKGTLPAGAQQGQITITVPEDLRLSRIEVETDLGDIYLESITAGEVELSADVGNITVSSGSFDLLDCDSDLGDVTVTAVEAVMLQCECDAGNIEAMEFDAKNTELSADLGGITAIAVDGVEDYDLELEVDLGELLLNGERKPNSYAQTVRGGRSLHAQVDTGDLTLDFTQQ